MFRKDLDKNMNVGLNQILVCLEDARLQGSTISGEKNFTLKKMRVFLRMSSFLTLGRVSESLYLMLRCFKVFRKENIWLRINIFLLADFFLDMEDDVWFCILKVHAPVRCRSIDELWWRTSLLVRSWLRIASTMLGRSSFHSNLIAK